MFLQKLQKERTHRGEVQELLKEFLLKTSSYQRSRMSRATTGQARFVDVSFSKVNVDQSSKIISFTLLNRNAALNRQNQPSTSHLQKVQGDMVRPHCLPGKNNPHTNDFFSPFQSEDEALARALALSMQDNSPSNTQPIPVGGATSSSSKDKCSLS
jgi:Ubiquitin interaction motif